jgi:hypothetical protein
MLLGHFFKKQTHEPASRKWPCLLIGIASVESPLNWSAVQNSLLVALAATLGTMVIHGLVVHAIITTLHRDLDRGRLGGRLWVNLIFVGGSSLFAFVGHLLEVILWAFVIDLCGGVADFTTALYCSASSYTTLDSGALASSPRWRLLGPLEAAAGMVMFGITTALIFAVIQRLIQARLDGPTAK